MSEAKPRWIMELDCLGLGDGQALRWHKNNPRLYPITA